MSLQEWIALCPDGIITDDVILAALELMENQKRAAKTSVDEPIPVAMPENDGTPGAGIGGAGKEGDIEPIDP